MKTVVPTVVYLEAGEGQLQVSHSAQPPLVALTSIIHQQHLRLRLERIEVKG
jgi:hypothetical protein